MEVCLTASYRQSFDVDVVMGGLGRLVGWRGCDIECLSQVEYLYGKVGPGKL